jgi:hypothetical protein
MTLAVAPSGMASVTLSTDATGYTPGGALTVTAVISVGSESLLGLAWIPELPSGWSIASVEGTGSPELGKSDGSVLWVGRLPATETITLTMKVKVPVWEYRSVSISGTGDIYLRGTNEALAPMAQTAVQSFVDQNADGIPDTFDSLAAFITAGVDLRIVAIQPTGDSIEIQWLGSPGRAQSFTVEYTDSLGGQYEVVGQGTMNVVEVIDAETVVFGFTNQSSTSSGFYRVRAHNPLESQSQVPTE